jgi:hypothetical protein
VDLLNPTGRRLAPQLRRPPAPGPAGAGGTLGVGAEGRSTRWPGRRVIVEREFRLVCSAVQLESLASYYTSSGQLPAFYESLYPDSSSGESTRALVPMIVTPGLRGLEKRRHLCYNNHVTESDDGNCLDEPH